MGVKCSLLGHDYGDADVERERAERGDEVVRTAKRVERCRSCGHERTVSENTEVTALEAAAGVVREPDGTVVAATGETNEAVSESSGEKRTVGPRTASNDRSESNGGVVIENIGKTGNALGSLSTEKGESGDENGNTDASEIDEIRDDRPEIRTSGPRRAPGEWPAEPSDEPTREPNAGAHRDDSAGLGSSGSLAAAQSDASGWPDETDAQTEPGAEPSERRNATGNGDESGIEASAPARPGDAFACPSCGFSAAVTDSPLRAGDICPGCHHGYLAWETRKG